MRTRFLLVGSVLAACGRVGFEAQTHDSMQPPDASIDAELVVPELRMMTAQEANGTGVQIDIPPTAPDSLLIVAFTTWNTGSPATSITAKMAGGADMALTPAAPRSILNGISSELWYSMPPAGTSTVTVMVAGSSPGFDVWTAEFANVAGAPAETVMGCSQYPPDLAVARVTTTVPGELVFGVTMFAAPIFVDGVDAPFVGLAYPTGNGAAYLVADQPGSYGPNFRIATGAGMSAATCATTARFLPAQ